MSLPVLAREQKWMSDIALSEVTGDYPKKFWFRSPLERMFYALTWKRIMFEVEANFIEKHKYFNFIKHDPT